MRWQRSAIVPADVRAELDVAAGERPLAAALDGDDRWVVGTDRALHLPIDDGWQVLPWQRVDRAGWDKDSERLVVVEVADFGEQQPQHELALRDPLRLLDLVRERVTASVLLTRHVPVEGSRGLKVVARRSPTGRGEIDWSTWLDDGLDPADPRVQRAVAEGLAAGRADLGL
ncbi:MAG: hypothetical protein H0U77_14555 [Nocardioidaceae bacterium]|nr:hypothetical protein [Nocardioidaceae bacterium]